MVDDVILLAPLAVLGVVLLLGFAGCGFEGQTGPPQLYIRARVPTGLTVIRISFAWESPSVSRKQEVVENPSGYVDGEDNVFTHYVMLSLANGTVVAEAWTVRCQVTVQGGADPGPAANGMFVLDGSDTHPAATFQATGDVATLALTFQGVQ